MGQKLMLLMGLILLSLCCPSVAQHANLTALKGQEIRVYYNVNPPSVVREEDGSYSGYLVTLLEEMQRDAGFTIVDASLSPEALNISKVPWVACVHDAAAKRIDLCLGTWWETPERRVLTPFIASLYPANFMLMVKSLEPTESDITAVFIPFAWELWGAILFCIAATAASLLFVEWYKQDEEYNPERGLAYAAGVSAYLGLMGLFSGGPAHGPRTMGGRVIITGYGFLILVVTASYTANLAAFLTVKNSATAYKDIEAVVRAGMPVCVSADVQSAIVTNYNPRTVPVIAARDGAKAILGPVKDPVNDEDAGKTCTAAVVYLEEMENLQKGDLCKLEFVGKSLAIIPVALPCTPRVEPILSYLVSDYRTRGLINAWVPTPPNYCQAEAAAESDSLLSIQLNISQMSGTFWVFGGALVLGLLISLGSTLRRRHKVAKTHALPTDKKAMDCVEVPVELGRQGSYARDNDEAVTNAMVMAELRKMQEQMNRMDAAIARLEPQASLV